MTAPTIQPPAQFWKELDAAEARRRELAKVTHEMRAKVSARVASNDEPEPRTFTDIHADGLREVQAVMREPLHAVPEKRK